MEATRFHLACGSVVLVACVGFSAAVGTAENGGRRGEVFGTYYGDPMYSVLPAGTIPAITEPQFLTGADANRQMSPQEPVLGLVIEGQERAYSLWHLDAHEIVNDVVAGVPVAVSW